MNIFEGLFGTGSREEKEEHAGGPSAFRAAWLQEKMKGDDPEAAGLTIMAPHPVAVNIHQHYPDARVIDTGEDLGGFERESLAKGYPSLSWVIVAKDGGATPIVVIENIQTGELLPNDQSIFDEESWKGEHNPFLDKIHRMNLKKSVSCAKTITV